LKKSLVLYFLTLFLIFFLNFFYFYLFQ